MNTNDNSKASRVKASKELQEEREAKEKLEKELAEAAALLVLRKKANAIWGTDNKDK